MKTLMKYSGVRPVEIKYEPVLENPNLIRVTRISDFTGQEHSMELPITEQQLINWLGTGSAPGQLIQNVMPHLPKDQREFLISGCTPEEWARIASEE